MGGQQAQQAQADASCPPANPADRRSSTRARWWFAALFLGTPLWWVLGISAIVPIVGALALLAALWNRGQPVHLPRGTLLWLLFLVWVALGVFLLGVDAPGAAPGGSGAGRLMVFGYRMSWYLACTAMLLWLGNTRRSALSDRWVHGCLAGVFVIATGGGLLGLLAPHFEFTSVLEVVLPNGLRSNAFVASLVHPEMADVQMVLGRPEARPKAPFAFTNTWGSVMALSGVFAVGWALTGNRRERLLVGVVMVAASIPVVFSLNRGLWGCVVIGVIGVVLLALRNGRARQLVVGGLVVAVLVVATAGPLVSLVNERLEAPHSNDRRGSLATATVDSVSTGSPVVGFGTTRDVQGSFASISGGSTPQCPACGVPPLGTQGHVWLVLFSQGWIGVGLFLSFLATALSRSWRCRTTNETVCTFVLAFFALQLFVYDTLGVPLMMVFIAIALVWREQREQAPRERVWTSPQLADRVKRGAPVALAFSLVGLGVGLAASFSQHATTFTTQVRVVLSSPSDPWSLAVVGDVLRSTGDTAPDRELPVTIDTEAALLLSEGTMKRAVNRLEERDPTATAQTLRAGVRLTAETNTLVLVLDVDGPSASTSRARATEIAASYLTSRQQYLDERRSDLLSQLSRDLRRVRATNIESSTLWLQLTAVDRRLRSDTLSVGRVVSVAPPVEQAVPTAVPATSGAALGLLGGTLAGALGRLRRSTLTQRRRA